MIKKIPTIFTILVITLACQPQKHVFVLFCDEHFFSIVANKMPNSPTFQVQVNHSAFLAQKARLNVPYDAFIALSNIQPEFNFPYNPLISKLIYTDTLRLYAHNYLGINELISKKAIIGLANENTPYSKYVDTLLKMNFIDKNNVRFTIPNMDILLSRYFFSKLIDIAPLLDSQVDRTQYTPIYSTKVIPVHFWLYVHPNTTNINELDTLFNKNTNS